MAAVTTLDRVYWPLMELDDIVLPRCAVCGRNWPLNNHHIVWRSWGQLVRDGKVLRRPVITLCGNGSHLGSCGSAEFCHGKAHHRMLHFRNDRGLLECLELDAPLNYMAALGMDGWRPVEMGET